MDIFSIQTQSNGLVEIAHNISGRFGKRLYLHVDQSSNIKNGEGDASILLTKDECKEIIGILNIFIKEEEGADYVVLLSELLKPGLTASTDTK